jgi:hypothetical protein
MQQTSTLMTLIPRIDTTPATLSSVQFTGPHTAPILSRLGDQGTSNPRLYHFGSDSNFDSNGFRPSSDVERHDFRAEQLTSELRRLKPINRTPDMTRDPTPEPTLSSKKRRASGLEPLEIDDSQSRAKRSRMEDSGDSLADTDRPSEAGRMRRRRASAPSVPARGRRRASISGSADAGSVAGSNSARPKRENLNEEQKRQNHIASEQKRRNQIRVGFEELHRLVPELHEGGLSKSNVLMESAAFLEALVNANTELRRRLGYPPEGQG